jgi:hypothetical protein
MLRALAISAAIAAPIPGLALELNERGDTHWVSGGIGEGERVDMLMLLPDYNLRVVTVAEKSGAYLAGVAVVVRDVGGGGVIFETTLEGPLLLARLWPGKYQLEATYGGKAHTRTFSIPATGRRDLYLYWAVPGAEAQPRGEMQ